jgi:methionyl-tRNA formyltransferase
MRFGFVTCVELGFACMRQIYDCDGKLDLAITLKDDADPGKSGRVFLDDFCSQHQIPLLKVSNINDNAARLAIQEAELDWLFIIGWSQIAKAPLLATVSRGCLGMHPTLLPIGRGRASIPWAIIKGIDRTGVSLFVLNEGVDTGPVLDQLAIAIDPQETATSLYANVTEAHRELLKIAWPKLIANEISPTIQDEKAATYWAARKPEDGELHLSMCCENADRLIRAVTHPYPGAFLRVDNRTLRIWAAQSDNASKSRPRLEPDSDGSLLIPFTDGKLRASEWNWED